MKKLPILLISGWAHGAEAMSPLADAMKDSHRVTCLSLLPPPKAAAIPAGGSAVADPVICLSLLPPPQAAAIPAGGPAAKGSHRVISLSLLPPPKAAAIPAGGPAAPAAPAAPISMYARAVISHLERFDEPSCIIGWSTGGIVAIEAAAGCPQKVAGLVLLSSTARFCAAIPAKDASAEEYTAGVEPAALRAMIRKLKRSPEEAIADFLLQAVFPMTFPADELALRTQAALEPGKDLLVDGLEYLARADLRGALPSIASPCLVVHGRQDRIVPWRAARFLGSNLPLASVELLPSIGHLLIEQGGKDLIHRIAQFVESL